MSLSPVQHPYLLMRERWAADHRGRTLGEGNISPNGFLITYELTQGDTVFPVSPAGYVFSPINNDRFTLASRSDRGGLEVAPSSGHGTEFSKVSI